MLTFGRVCKTCPQNEKTTTDHDIINIRFVDLYWMNHPRNILMSRQKKNSNVKNLAQFKASTSTLININ